MMVRRYEKKYRHNNSFSRESERIDNERINRINGVYSNQDPRWRDYIQPAEQSNRPPILPGEREYEARKQARRDSEEWDMLYRPSRPQPLAEKFKQRRRSL